MDSGSQGAVQGVSADGLPALFSLKGDNRLYQFTAARGWQLLDDGAGEIAMGADQFGRPALYDLKTNGLLYQYTFGGFTLLDDGARDIAWGADAQGRPALYDLKTNGLLYQYTTGGFTLLDNQTGKIAHGVDQFGRLTMFDLKTNGLLYQYTVGGFTLLDNQTQTIEQGVDQAGRAAVFDLKTTNGLYQYGQGGFTLLDDQSAGISAGYNTAGQLALVDIKTTGAAYQYTNNGLGFTALTKSDVQLSFLQAKLNKGPFYGQLGAGECADVATESLRVAGYEFDSKDGNSQLGMLVDDYQWGTLIATFTAGGPRTASVRPGDVLQYRDAYFSDHHATHHTSVVAAVNANGLPTEVYEQNIDKGGTKGAVRYVTRRAINMTDLQSGKVWAYRPVARADRPGDGYNHFKFTLANNTPAVRSVTIGFTGATPDSVSLKADNILGSFYTFDYYTTASTGPVIKLNGSSVTVVPGGGYEVYLQDGVAKVRRLSP
jgi:hypothetical protein